MKAYNTKSLTIYPKNVITEDGAYLMVRGRADWEGYSSTESVGLSDDEVDALHQWLGELIAERGSGS